MVFDTNAFATHIREDVLLVDQFQVPTFCDREDGLVDDHQESEKKRKRDEDTHGAFDGSVTFVFSGLDNSGKTTIVKKINGEDISDISPTLGFNIKTMQYKKYRLNIWDVGGQKTLRSYWRNYYEQTDGLVWVVDSADLRRLDDCRHELHNLLKQEKLSGASLLILANKQDIGGALKPEEIAKALQLDVMNTTRHWIIVGCSAVTGDGLLAAFDWLVEDIGSRIYVLD